MRPARRASYSRGWGGGDFLVTGLWGCAAGWGRIFTTGLTIMGLHFQQSYWNGVAYFRELIVG